ncbi:MAG: pilus assembly protein [Armatimonadetes bacterium]|nr:pilus assembly protein [Armatimonadota bacterium]
MRAIRRRDARRGQRGAALVEFALCAGLLLLILFGLIEMGLLLGDAATLGQAAREAARSLAVGSAPSVAANRAISSANGLPLTGANVVLEKSHPDGSGNPTAWAVVGASGSNNDAVTGDFVRATVTYNHPLITSLVFAGGTKTLTESLTMRRE